MPFIKMFLVLALLSTACFASENSSIPTYTAGNAHISVSQAETAFRIQLKANPTTGYSWSLQSYDHSSLELREHHYQATQNKTLIGAPGIEVWSFSVKPPFFKKGKSALLQFSYARPWERKKAAEVVSFEILAK